MFTNKIKTLQQRLQEELPGRDAQLKMAFKGRNKVDIYPIPENARHSAVLILLFPKDDGIYLPLIQRPVYQGVHSGQIAFPGGKREEEDLSLEHTALRETLEEIGVNVKEEQILGKLTDLYIPPSNMLVLPVVAYSETPPEYLLDEKEVVKVLEPSLDQLRAPETINHKDIAIRNGMKINTPYFDVEGHTVWGATAMMISEFLVLSEGII